MKKSENNIKEILSSIEDKIIFLENEASDNRMVFKKLLNHLKELESTVKSLVDEDHYLVESDVEYDNAARIRLAVDPEFIINQFISSTYDISEFKELEDQLQKVKDMIIPGIVGKA